MEAQYSGFPPVCRPPHPTHPHPQATFLKFYYKYLFPYNQMTRWISYGNDADGSSNPANKRDFFARREWTFTMEDDV